MTELKPCPFCDGEVEWENGVIKCWHCGLSFRPVMADHDKTNELWNRRVKQYDYEL